MNYRTGFIITLLGIIGLLVLGVGKEAFAIQIHPENVEVTIYLSPGGKGEGEYPLPPFRVTADSEEKEEEKEKTYTAISDAVWLQITDGDSGGLPGTIKASIVASYETFPEEGDYEGKITVYSDKGNEAVATVLVHVFFKIPDKLTVNPSAMTFNLTRANLSRRTFTVELKNANYERNDFKWSAEVVDSWITVSPMTGEGASTIQVTVNPAILTAGTHTGTVKFRSNLPTQNSEDAEATLTITVIVTQPNELTVFPSYLFWSVEISEDGTLATSGFTPQILHVYAGGYGFSLNYNVPWIDIEFLNPASGENSKSLATTQSEGIFRITPQASILQTYGTGRYEGIITVVDRGSAFYREVPVIVEIRNPGDPISLPVIQPTFSQMAPGFIMVDATDAHSLHMLLHVDDNLAVYSTPEACTAVGGTWLDPFMGQGSSGTGLPYCSESEKVYVLLTAPQKQPNKVYAYTPVIANKYLLVYQNGERVNETIDPFFSIGPIPEASFGPMLLAGLKGQMFISIRAGKNVESTREMQEVQVNVNTLEGSWVVSENYRGKSYTYGTDKLLTLSQNQDGMTYSGTWGATPVTASISDGKTLLYKIEFMEGGIFYEYWVTYLTATEMKGKWRFSYGGDSSKWEGFSAVRTNGGIGVGNPFNN